MIPASSRRSLSLAWPRGTLCPLVMVNAGMAEPLTDRDDVNAGPEKEYGRAVAHAVGMRPLRH